MAVSIYRISREYVWWRIDTLDNLVGATAEVACIDNPDDIPAEEDWVEANLISPDDPNFGDDENWWVQLLIGPDGPTGTLSLDDRDPAEYPIDFQTWVRIDDVGDERPVRKPGVVTVL